MKRLFQVFIIFFMITPMTTSQWYVVHPLGKANLNSVCYSDDDVFVLDNKGFLNFSTDNGSNWFEKQIASNTSLNAIEFTDYSVSYIVGNRGNIFISETNWKDWKDISVDDYFHLDDVKFISSGRGVTVGTKEVIIDGRTYFLPSMHITNSYGFEWKEIQFDFRGKLNSVAYSEKGLIIAVGDTGLMLYSTDFGKTWSQEYLRTDNNFNSVRLCPDNTIIIAGDRGSFYYSDYPGEKWKKIQLPEYYNIKSACFKEKGIIVAAGTKYMEKENNSFTVAALVSIDVETNKWSEEFAKIYGKYNSVSFCNPETAIAVGDNGIITLYNSPAAFEDPYNSTNKNFDLYQNHPNPFNPLTVIIYHLPVSSDVTLKVFDIVGNEIATLVDEYKPAGRYEVEFSINSGEGRNLSSGVYIYRLKAGDFLQMRKMILLK
jgi:photosystem II stability/assembly factor-like uncharacterized protein